MLIMNIFAAQRLQVPKGVSCKVLFCRHVSVESLRMVAYGL